MWDRDEISYIFFKYGHVSECMYTHLFLRPTLLLECPPPTGCNDDQYRSPGYHTTVAPNPWFITMPTAR